MARALVTSASCWLAISTLACAALAETMPESCVAQECEIEDSSLLSIRRAGARRLAVPPSLDLAAYVSERNRKLHPVPFSNFTPAHATDEVEVFWITAPLSPVTTVFKGLAPLVDRMIFGLYHVGIGFRNVQTRLESDAQFYAKDFGTNLLNPRVNHTTRSWTWDRAATIHFEEGTMNRSYWTKGQAIAKIKGSDYNKLMPWIGDLAKNLTDYVLFTLAPWDTPWVSLIGHQHLPGAPATPGLPPGSSTCMDAAAKILRGLEEVAGSQVFEAGVTVRRDDQFQWMAPGTKAVKLNITGGPGSKDHDFAFEYFSKIQKLLDDDLIGVGGLELDSLGSDWVFTDINGQYWRFKPHDLLWAEYRESIALPLSG